MKVAQAVEIMRNAESDLYECLISLRYQTSYRGESKLVEAYYRRQVALRPTVAVECPNLKFLTKTFQWLHRHTQRALDTVNLVHVEDERKGKRWAWTTDGSAMNRVPTDLPLGNYALIDGQLYFMNDDPCPSVYVQLSKLTYQGTLEDAELHKNERYKYYEVNGVLLDSRYVFDKKWHLFTQEPYQPLVLAESIQFDEGPYSVIMPLR